MLARAKRWAQYRFYVEAVTAVDINSNPGALHKKEHTTSRESGCAGFCLMSSILPSCALAPACGDAFLGTRLPAFDCIHRTTEPVCVPL